ncbi:MAG: hypothetical protein OXB88_06560 [Bacteriovoracales bacterium]|nr:hypothetical protein [Bacteriovoracales bacterium]
MNFKRKKKRKPSRRVRRWRRYGKLLLQPVCHFFFDMPIKNDFIEESKERYLKLKAECGHDFKL